MKQLISTYCDMYKGDFLINHWLKSLQAHVDLTGIDVMVIDFGLTVPQREALKQLGVLVNEQEKPTGKMSNVQYKFLSEYLNQHPYYDQVLYCDCGDIIFQGDVSHLFKKARDKMKLVLEPNFNFYLHKLTLGLQDVKPEKIKDIKKVLGEHATANCGFVLGPASMMATIWEEYQQVCRTANLHGTDQLLINYIIYRDGFEILDEKYNYVTFLKKGKISMNEQGYFVNKNEVIPVVHNAGKYNFARSISQFGYRRGKIKSHLFINCFRYYYKMLYYIARAL